MENDLNDFQNNETNYKDYFKIEYVGQQLNKENKEFQKWKKEKIDKYGKLLELYKCTKDNIIFCDYHSKSIINQFYESMCPICHKYICYFCEVTQKDSSNNGNCCITKRICYLFLEGSKKYIKEESFFNNCEDYLLIMPIINLLYFMAGMQNSLFATLSKKFPKIEYTRYRIKSYEEYYKNNKRNIYLFLLWIIALFGLTLIIPFILLNIYFILFILLISIPFKKYPLYYAIGFMISAFKD